MKKYAALLLVAMIATIGCQKKKEYGRERQLFLPMANTQVWAVAPVANLSGINDVDPLLQADLLYAQLQTVAGVKAIPVNRVLEVYASLQIDGVQSEKQAALVCDLLGADGLIVATVTAYDPYHPPKVGVSLQLFTRNGGAIRSSGIDPRELSRMASPGNTESLPYDAQLLQVVGIYDAANGSIREKLLSYADGRNDPIGPMGAKEYFASMDRFSSFVYHDLLEQLLPRLATYAAN